MLSKVHNVGGKQMHPRGFFPLILTAIMILFLIIAQATPVTCFAYAAQVFGAPVGSCQHPFSIGNLSENDNTGLFSGYNTLVKAYAAFLQLSFWLVIVVAVLAALNAIAMEAKGPVVFSSKLVTGTLLVLTIFFLLPCWAMGFATVAKGNSEAKVFGNVVGEFKVSASPFFALLAWLLTIAATVLSILAAPGPNDSNAEAPGAVSTTQFIRPQEYRPGDQEQAANEYQVMPNE